MTAPTPLFSQLARGGAAVAVAQGLRLLLRFGSMISLARLLTPEAFGVFGMASLVYGLLQTVRDLGLGTVAIQRGDQSVAERTQFFWLATAAGLAVAAVTCLLAGPVAAGFDRPELRAVLLVLAVSFAFGGLGVQFRVELSRDLRFQRIGVVELSGLAAGLGAAIVLAALGWSYWALVGMILVQDAVGSAGFMLATRWRPQGRPAWAGTRDHLRRGLHLCGHGVAHYATHMVDQALVASRLGPLALGYYGRSWQLGTLPTHGLLAGLHGWMRQGLVRLRDDPESFRAWCRQVLNLLLYGCAPLGAILACAPHAVLRVLLGPGWEPAAVPLAWLALTFPAQVWTFLELNILVACRQERRLFGWSAVRLGTLAAALWIGHPTDLAGVALAMAAGKWLLVIPGLALIMRSSPLRWGDVGRAALAPMLLGGFTGLALLLTRSWWSAARFPVIALALVTAGLFLVFVLAWPRVRRELGAAGRLLVGATP